MPPARGGPGPTRRTRSAGRLVLVGEAGLAVETTSGRAPATTRRGRLAPSSRPSSDEQLRGERPSARGPVAEGGQEGGSRARERAEDGGPRPAVRAVAGGDPCQGAAPGDARSGCRRPERPRAIAAWNRTRASASSAQRQHVGEQPARSRRRAGARPAAGRSRGPGPTEWRQGDAQAGRRSGRRARRAGAARGRPSRRDDRGSAASARSGPTAAGSRRSSRSRWAVSRRQPSGSRRSSQSLRSTSPARSTVRSRRSSSGLERRRGRPARSGPSSCRPRSRCACGSRRGGSRGARSSCGTCRRRRGRRRARGRGRRGGTSCRCSPGTRPRRAPDGPRRWPRRGSSRSKWTRLPVGSHEKAPPRYGVGQAGAPEDGHAAGGGERAGVRVGGRDVPADREEPGRGAVALQAARRPSRPGSPGRSRRTPGAGSAAGPSRRSRRAGPAPGCSR